jgi:hypothetical protein
MEFTAYGVTERGPDGVPRAAIGFLDAEGAPTSFSGMDKVKIASHFYTRPPYPGIDITPAPLNDSNQRSHERAPDYVSESGRRVWIFPSAS